MKRPVTEKASRSRRRKATLRDVAAKAGVSLASTSRALSRPEITSPELRELVQRACDSLGYVPNHLARSLSMKRTLSVGAIIPTIDNPVFAPMVQGILERLGQSGYALSIGFSNRDKDEEFRQVRSMAERGTDAILLGNPVHAAASIELLQRLNIPFVSLGGPARDRTSHVVTFDGAKAIALAVDHLVQAGHTRIAVFSGTTSVTPVIADRLNGAIKRIKAHGLALPDGWIVEAGFSPAEARAGAAGLLRLADRPAAVVCTGDFHAMALLSEAQQHDIDVPDQMSITGCNEMFYIHLTSPILTTVRTPYLEVGRAAAEMALRLVNGDATPSRVLLEARLVEGQTVKAPVQGTAKAKTARSTDPLRID